MRIQMHGEFDMTVSEFHSAGFDVATDENVHAHYSALQMFITSLALCTASVLMSYGEQIDTEPHELKIRIKWELEEKPNRVGRIAMDVLWPKLPESRLVAAQRAAAHCAIHNTLHHPPEVATTLRRE